MTNITYKSCYYLFIPPPAKGLVRALLVFNFAGTLFRDVGESVSRAVLFSPFQQLNMKKGYYISRSQLHFSFQKV